ncbi:MAG TPA: hypothetical protein VKD71_07980 [Gemmataceae bacterium]|nr:hypothetical protein [Gemmataceae bacterium]
MSETKARQIVLVARPQGKPRLTDFRLEETAIPARGPGQILLRVQYLSLDPYMRGRMDDRESYAQPYLAGTGCWGRSFLQAEVGEPWLPLRSCGKDDLAGFGFGHVMFLIKW